MPAPTEQHAQDQRLDASDARKRLDESVAQWRGEVDRGERLEGRLGDLESVLADADRDRQFVEAMRANIVNHRMCFALQSCAEMAQSLDRVHADIYGTPCAAKEKA